MIRMKRSSRLVLLLVMIVPAASACSSGGLLSRSVPHRQEAPFTRLMLMLAEGEDRDRLQRALKEGPEAFEEALEAYWNRWDPTPGSRINEYRALIEARFHIGMHLFEGSSDERTFAYTLYGTPTQVAYSALPTRFTQLSSQYIAFWFYQPETAVQEAARAIPVLRNTTAFTLQLEKRGREVPKKIVKLQRGVVGQPPPRPARDRH